jgi:RNA polymerase sigma-70 factor (ECF subfamily)
MGGERRVSSAVGSVPPPRTAVGTREAEHDDLAALRRGDQSAFMELVRRLHPSMVRVASTYVSSREVGEEVAQDTWLAVLEELDRFEGRSSLKTWIFRILTNQAKTRGRKERRSTPFSALEIERQTSDPTMPPDRFFDQPHRWAGHWAVPVRSWELPEEHLMSDELGGVIQHAIDELPPAQRTVVVLRDCQSLSSHEVRELLDLSESNQRVLLHRARLRVRAAVGAYVDQVGAAV